MRRTKRMKGRWILGMSLGLAIGTGAGLMGDAEAQASAAEQSESMAPLACVMDSDCPPGKCCKSIWIFQWCLSC